MGSNARSLLFATVIVPYWVFAPLVLAAGRSDPAQSAADAAGGGMSRSPRSFVQGDDATLEHQVGANLRFLSADGAGGVDPIKFAELVLLGLDGYFSFGKLHLHASGDLMPKQPYQAKQHVAQSAALQARLGLGRNWSLDATGAIQDLTTGRGGLGITALGWSGRTFIDSEEKGLALAGRLAGWGRRPIGARGADIPWVAYAQIGGDIQLLSYSQSDGGNGGGFAVGTDFYFPVAYDGLAYWAGGVPFDPQTMVSFHMSAFITLGTQWDFFLSYLILDNGDRDAPQTTLPVIDGGFDQSQWIFGISYRLAAPKRTHTVLFLE